MANVAAKKARRLALVQKSRDSQAQNLIMREKSRAEGLMKRERKEKHAWERATLQARFQRAKAGFTNVEDYLTPRVRKPRGSRVRNVAAVPRTVSQKPTATSVSSTVPVI